MDTTQKPPGPRARFPGAHLLAFRRDNLGFLSHLSQTYGDVVAFRLGPERVVLLTHPDHIHGVLVTHHRNFVKGRRGNVANQFLGEGLLNSEGAIHQRQRRLTQPAFHRQRVSTYGTIMTDAADRLRQQWRDGETLDVAHAMMQITLAIVGQTLFSTDITADTNTIGSAISTLLHFSPRFSMPFAAWLTKLPFPSNKRLRQAQQILDSTIYRIIDDRRRTGLDQGDLLSMLLLAQDDTADGSGMTDRQVHDEALTLLLAGHETTALALTWTWYLLSQHPTIEASLHAELDAVLDGRLPTIEDLSQLTYTRNVFTEVLRLYPPAWLMTRRALAPYQAGAYTLPAGTFILISPYLTHHDPRFFPNPEAFEPQRWETKRHDEHTKIRIFPLRRRPTTVYWRRLCLDGRHSTPGHPSAAVAPAPGAGSSGSITSSCHPSTSSWYAYDARTALTRPYAAGRLSRKRIRLQMSTLDAAYR